MLHWPAGPAPSGALGPLLVPWAPSCCRCRRLALRPPAGPGQPPAGGPGPAPPRSASRAGFGAAPPGAGRHERGRALRRRWGRLWVQVGAGTGTGPRGAWGWGLLGWAGSAPGAPAQVFGCCCAESLRAPQVSLPSPPLPSCPLSLGIPSPAVLGWVSPLLPARSPAGSCVCGGVAAGAGDEPYLCSSAPATLF